MLAKFAKVLHDDVLESVGGAPLVANLHEDARTATGRDALGVHRGFAESAHRLAPVLLAKTVMAHGEELPLAHRHLLVEDEAHGGPRRLTDVAKDVHRASGQGGASQRRRVAPDLGETRVIVSRGHGDLEGRVGRDGGAGRGRGDGFGLGFGRRLRRRSRVIDGPDSRGAARVRVRRRTVGP